jgi:alginate O-acetyltransferase complex protein AlgI
MVFSDPLFLFLYLPLLLLGYLLAPVAARNTILLVASLGFYAIGEGKYTSVMLGAIAFNYLGARVLDSGYFSSGYSEARKVALGIGIAINLGALVYFKYTNFLLAEANRVLVSFGQAPIEMSPVHLPLGISFFVFQGMSYLIDVYRREIPAERSPFRFALFKALFPQLIAGPIVRYPDVAAQLPNRQVTLANLTLGSQRFIVGLGKKVLLANPTGAVADRVFVLPLSEVDTPIAWLGLVCYAFQIYFDFSGYSDMAIGLGRIFGFEFRENFDYPYTARSVTDFWRRWHLSLSTWFRDYLYIPLGGNRLGPRRTYLNLFIVFALCGLWHGASWNFLIWGLWHGALLATERAFLSRLLEGRRLLGHAYALAAVAIGWIFFRAETLDQALTYLAALAGAHASAAGQPVGFFFDSELALVLAAAVLASTPWPKQMIESSVPRVPHWASLAGLLLGGSVLLLICGAKVAAGAYSPFIYFRF